jgi:glycerol uptake facilitator-like aquaporin
MDRSLIRELAAECLGTFLLIAFGVGSVAQMVLEPPHARHDAVCEHRVGPGGDARRLCVGACLGRT